MIVETRAVGPFFKNGFVVGCEITREAIVIDPGDEVQELVSFARRERLVVKHILLTHAHIDHVTGVGPAKKVFSVPVHLHPADLFLYEAAADQALMFGLPVPELPDVDAFYEEGQIIAFGEYVVRPLHTPGHCPGGVCLQVGRRTEAGQDLFVGDTLFAGSIGRTDLPGGDYERLLASIRNVLLPLGDGARVYPGHGPMTTIGQERRTNPFLTR